MFIQLVLYAAVVSTVTKTFVISTRTANTIQICRSIMNNVLLAVIPISCVILGVNTRP